jgi:hypothetical protein
MRIEFERSGGFMGLTQAVIVDTAAMEPHEADELTAMVETANFFELPELMTAASAGSDRFQYRLTIEASELKHTVVTTEMAAPEALQPLLQRLNMLARTRHKN